MAGTQGKESSKCEQAQPGTWRHGTKHEDILASTKPGMESKSDEVLGRKDEGTGLRFNLVS